MQLTIIIVNWRVREALRNCLSSIEKYASDIDCQTIVIDNDSRDGSVDMIGDEFPKVTVIANQTNKGFAAAVNQGIKIAQGDYILLLNPDCELQPGTLARLIASMYAQPDIGVLGSKIVNPDGSIQPSVRRFPDLASQILVLLKLINIWPNLKPLRHYLYRDFDYTREQDVDQVMGAVFMIRRELLKKIGLLDEKFYIWYEEVDFCQRTKAAGYRVVYTPVASCVHQRGASFKQLLPIRRQMILNRSMLHYFAKHLGSLKTCIILLVMPINILLTLGYSLLPSHARKTI